MHSDINFTHLRNHHDKHIFSTQECLTSLLKMITANVTSRADLAQLIATFSPEALEEGKHFSLDLTELPSSKLIAAIAQLASEDGIQIDDISSARKYLHENEISSGNRLSILKRVPSSNIHRMQRGEYWIGDIYSSNMLVASLNEIGFYLKDGMTVLDYGCSSGSLLRVLSYCYPGLIFLGCDPISSAIKWADENLKFENLSFFHQEQLPPLNIVSETVDLVTAISIFSHHGINAARLWLTEIARILKPGGLLVMTYNDVGSLFDHANKNDRKSYKRILELYIMLLESGYVFEEVWTDRDDAGNVATANEWGNSYYSRLVIYALSTPYFQPLYHARRLNQGRQDLLILRKW